MIRLNAMLLLAVLLSALYLVDVQYQSRRLFVELEHEQAQARRLDAQRERLQLDKRDRATPLHIERLASSQLRMHTATPAITQYVTLAAPSAPPAAETAPAPLAGAASKAKP